MIRWLCSGCDWPPPTGRSVLAGEGSTTSERRSKTRSTTSKTMTTKIHRCGSPIKWSPHLRADPAPSHAAGRKLGRDAVVRWRSPVRRRRCPFDEALLMPSALAELSVSSKNMTLMSSTSAFTKDGSGLLLHNPFHAAVPHDSFARPQVACAKSTLPVAAVPHGSHQMSSRSHSTPKRLSTTRLRPTSAAMSSRQA